MSRRNPMYPESPIPLSAGPSPPSLWVTEKVHVVHEASKKWASLPPSRITDLDITGMCQWIELDGERLTRWSSTRGRFSGNLRIFYKGERIARTLLGPGSLVQCGVKRSGKKFELYRDVEVLELVRKQQELPYISDGD